MSRKACALLAICLLMLPGCSLPVRAENKKHPDEEKGLKSLNSDTEAEIRFVNRSGQTVEVYWLDFDGKRKYYQTLKDGEFYDQPTFLTHPWLVTDENGDAWEIYLPAKERRTIDIPAPKKK